MYSNVLNNTLAVKDLVVADQNHFDKTLLGGSTTFNIKSSTEHGNWPNLSYCTTSCNIFIFTDIQ